MSHEGARHYLPPSPSHPNGRDGSGRLEPSPASDALMLVLLPASLFPQEPRFHLLNGPEDP